MNVKVIVIAAIAATILATAEAELPRAEGWKLISPTPDKYVVWSDSTTTISGIASIGLKSKNNDAKEYATARHKISPEKYVNQRIRFSGYIKTQNVTGSAGLLLHIDGATGENVTFYKTQIETVTGITDWRRREVLIDVPAGATSLAFGLSLDGAGTVWVDKLSIEVVTPDVPTTSKPQSTPTLPSAGLR